MKNLSRLGIFYGVSITVTKDNLGTVTDEAFLSDLREIGCRLIFYVEYVPADGNNEPALEEKERQILEKRQAELRSSFPDVIFLSFPGDEKEMGGCLAAGRGFFPHQRLRRRRALPIFPLFGYESQNRQPSRRA